MFLRSCSLCLLLAAAAIAAEPKAVIVGPDTAAPGDLIILSGQKSTYDGKLIKWALAGNKTFYDAGDHAIFASGTPGAYTFVLFVGGFNADRTALLTDVATKTVTIGQPGPTPPVPPVPPGPEPGPNPGPNPPVPPTPDSYGFARLVVDAAAKIDPTPRALAPQVAANFEAVAAAIAAGTKTDPVRIQQDTLELNKTTLGVHRDAWSPVSDALRVRLAQIPVTTPAQFRKAWTEIATGLRQVKAW